ncbi:hypothetical protein ACP70R_005762 [Stipagrostis hirtigluma subsp. patula]
MGRSAAFSHWADLWPHVPVEIASFSKKLELPPRGIRSLPQTAHSRRFSEGLMEAAKAVGAGKRRNPETYVLTWKLNERQQLLVDASGLGNLKHVAGLAIDRSLLRAFCKLWNKETNTARFHDFEMAPSLKDATYILGVPVTGRVVTTGRVVKKATNELCLEYLGKFPGPNDSRDSYVKLSWLYSKFSQLSEHPTDEEIMFSTRAYLLCLIGSNLLPGRDTGFVSPKYLPLLSDFEKIRDYAWGMAALAHLYKSLSLAGTSSSVAKLSGSATLLMAWIYEYIPVLRPKMKYDPARIFPRVRRWMGIPISKRTKGVLALQQTFSLLRVSDINWEPYKSMNPESIPRTCVAPDNVCFSRTWLISFNLREIYVPDRYARQFGKEQHPLSDNYVPWFQRLDWNRHKDWSLEYASDIEQFEQLINATHHDHTAAPASCHTTEAHATQVEDTKNAFLAMELPGDEVVEMCHLKEGDVVVDAKGEWSSEPHHQLVALDPPIAPAHKQAAGGTSHDPTQNGDPSSTNNSAAECSDMLRKEANQDEREDGEAEHRADEGDCTEQKRQLRWCPAVVSDGELRWSDRHCDQIMRPVLLLLWCGVVVSYYYACKFFYLQ